MYRFVCEWNMYTFLHYSVIVLFVCRKCVYLCTPLILHIKEPLVVEKYKVFELAERRQVEHKSLWYWTRLNHW